MAIRYLKITLVLFVALLCVMYAAQNLANLDAAYGFVSSVLAMEGHQAYPSSFGPAIANPLLIWTALSLIILTEFTAGLVAAKGAWDLFAARSKPADAFNAAKTCALLGCGLGLVVWFGYFSAIGGTYFQMWQTPLGGPSLAGAFQASAQIGIVLLFVNMPDR